VELRVVSGRSRTRAGRPHAALCRGMARAQHGTCESALRVNQTRPHCVNQMGKTQSKPSAEQHGRGTAWTLRGNGIGTARYV
jgi:hypothetical protein